MSVRMVVALAALAATTAVPAQGEEGLGLAEQMVGGVYSTSGPGRERVDGVCYVAGQISLEGVMRFAFGGQAVATSTSRSQPELTAVQCTLVSPAQGLPGERPTLTATAGPQGCPGPVCAVDGEVSSWPVRPVLVCIEGHATAGPFPVVEKEIVPACGMSRPAN